MEFDTIPSQYKKQIIGLYSSLHKRKFVLMEKKLLTLIAKILNEKTSDECDQSDNIVVLILIYSNFNGFFSDWLKHSNKGSERELISLQNNEHHNLLISHCSDPASMDDLLWEISNYLEDPKIGKEEAEHQLACYKDSLL